MWVSVVIKLFIFIHPHFSCTHAVCQSFDPRVWSLFGENMTYMGARMDLKTSSTLPYLSKELTVCIINFVFCKLKDIVTISLCKNNTVSRTPHHTTSNTYNNFVSHLMTKWIKLHPCCSYNLLCVHKEIITLWFYLECNIPFLVLFSHDKM